MSNVISTETKKNVVTGSLFDPPDFESAMKMAEMIAKSSFCPVSMKDKPGDIILAIELGKEVGLKPLQALQNIAVINGRPCVWGDAALALVRSSGLLEYYDEGVKDNVGFCTVKRTGQKEQTKTFSIEDAKKANLWGKSGPWTTYPQRMLPLRARSWALRDVFSDVLKGVFIREEVMDYEGETYDQKATIPNPGYGAEATIAALKIQDQVCEPTETIVDAEGSKEEVSEDNTDSLLQLKDLISENKIGPGTTAKWLIHFKVKSLEELSVEDINRLISKIENSQEE